MGDGGEAFAWGEGGPDLVLDGELHAAGDILHGDFIRETHVFGQVQVLYLDLQGRGSVFGKGFWEASVGVGIGDTPAVDEDNFHVETRMTGIPLHPNGFRCNGFDLERGV